MKGGPFPPALLAREEKQSFRYYETGSPFEYELIRGLYLRSRELLIEN